MFDRYTKIVLTVIAVALSAIALQGAIGSAHAAFSECGGNSFSPCYIEHVGVIAGLPDAGLKVEVTNWPSK